MPGLPFRAPLLWCAVALLFIVGCGGADDSVEVFPVKGTVNFNGKPMVGGGSIAFVPTGGQKGKAAGGTINSDGTYELTTYEAGDGSMVGDFRVVITQVVYEEPQNAGDSDERGGEVEAVEVVSEADRIPMVYSDAVSSPLSATVEAREQTLDFELKPQQPGA
jgi:hypothetical protein